MTSSILSFQTDLQLWRSSLREASGTASQLCSELWISSCSCLETLSQQSFNLQTSNTISIPIVSDSLTWITHRYHLHQELHRIIPHSSSSSCIRVFSFYVSLHIHSSISGCHKLSPNFFSLIIPRHTFLSLLTASQIMLYTEHHWDSSSNLRHLSSQGGMNPYAQCGFNSVHIPATHGGCCNVGGHSNLLTQPTTILRFSGIALYSMHL